jgi:hypothetical protein
MKTASWNLRVIYISTPPYALLPNIPASNRDIRNVPKGNNSQIRQSEESTHRHRVTVLNTAGIIEERCPGEAGVIVVNLSKKKYNS